MLSAIAATATLQRPMSPKERLQWNEEMIHRYRPSKTHHPRALVRWLEERRMNTILRMLDPQPGDRVLDVGCGDGEMLERMKPGILFGIDLSPCLVSQAQGRLGIRATVTQGDIEATTPAFSPQSFEKICCSEVLEHLQHPSVALSTIFSLLTHGGTLALSIPNEHLINRLKALLLSLGLFQKILGDGVAKRMEQEWHLSIFRKQDCVRLLQETGFRIESTEGSPFSWLPIRYMFLARRP